MIARAVFCASAVWAGVAAADEVSFHGGDLILSLPVGMTVGRSFGEGDARYAVDLMTPTIEESWLDAGRGSELADMDRMEAAFGLSFASLDCTDIASGAPVRPTKCKNSIGMSILAIDRSTPDSGALLGNQMGLLAEDVDALWAAGAWDTMLTTFCANETHPHRVEDSRDDQSVICISDRPALAPHFLSFRLMINTEHAVVMYAQNVQAETDVIMTYGVDDFLALIEGATDIETTLFAESEKYVAKNDRSDIYLLDTLSAVSIVE
ncbi:hypothetical protein SAMN04488515_1259 [Cognatiyoonia koreensis]|uniref:Uncharacterized protein n=1 Tax=Cognatiyoonia koreensis TaxID=364200 RepID=A0A1I0PIS8_9RHOB|nr:hypothetical protein [Cognatiyoonia koreensis]SEW14385.1 hypothetical protein SAMN04488515_1259 [Cognatiyoonia koreensis]